LEQGEASGERDEQRVARLYGFAGDDVARFGGRAWASVLLPTPPGPNIATRAWAAGGDETTRSTIFFTSASRPKKT